MYPLKVNGEIVETLYKTRNLPIADKTYTRLTEDVMTDQHIELVEKSGLSHSYELYGTKNKHEVNYDIQGIELNLDLICSMDQGLVHPYGKSYKDIPEVMRAFNIELQKDGYYVAEPTLQLKFRYSDWLPDTDAIASKDPGFIYEQIEMFFEQMNMKYQQERKGGIICEGSVWHIGANETKMLKCKATSVRDNHVKQACGISSIHIRTAINKAKENGFDIADLDQRKDVFEYVKLELAEDNPADLVNDIKVKQKFYSVIQKMTAKFKIDDECKEIAQQVIDKVGNDADPAEKMKAFARMFPGSTKRLGKKMYGTFVNME